MLQPHVHVLLFPLPSEMLTVVGAATSYNYTHYRENVSNSNILSFFIAY